MKHADSQSVPGRHKYKSVLDWAATVQFDAVPARLIQRPMDMENLEEPCACTSDATRCWRCWLRRMVLQLPEGCAGGVVAAAWRLRSMQLLESVVPAVHRDQS